MLTHPPLHAYAQFLTNMIVLFKLVTKQDRALHCFQQGIVPCAPSLLSHLHTHTCHYNTPLYILSSKDMVVVRTSLIQITSSYPKTRVSGSTLRWSQPGPKNLTSFTPLMIKMDELCACDWLYVYIFIHQNIAVCVLWSDTLIAGLLACDFFSVRVLCSWYSMCSYIFFLSFFFF